MISKIKKPVSILLSLIMVFSMFAIVPFTAGATEKTIAEGVIYKLGDTIVLPGSGVYYVKVDRYSTRTVSGNGTITLFEGDEYFYELEIEDWYINTRLDTFDYWEEMEQGLSVLGIKFTGSGTQSDPYLLKLAFGEVESTWAGEGEGTESAPWLINDVNDLRALSANVQSGMTYSGKYLKLTADIDCSGTDAVPIGGDKTFAGTFDGDGNTITYSIISSENDAPKGLFAKIGSAGTVKNLNVAGSIVNTASYAGPAGGIAAYNSGLIENCYSAVDITKGCDRGTGGIAASNEEGATISFCAASGTLTWTGASGYYAYIGGITGEAYLSTVTNSTSLCNVLAENAQNSWDYAGIFIGRAYSNDVLPACYYLSTATTAGEVNSGSATPKTADELKAIGQAAYDAGYTVYGLALGASAGETITLDLNADNADIYWDDSTAEDEYWRIDADYDDGNKSLTLTADDVAQAAGTFTIGEEMSTSSCCIIDPEASEDIYFTAGSCTVTVDGDTVTVEGSFTGSDGNTYNVTITYVAPTYTITWNNWDDTELEKDTGVAEGANPEYNGATPYKADGADCIYTFSGWTPEVSAVTGDATYTAQFTESEKPETIKDCTNKYGDFRLYANVPLVQYSDFEDILDGAIIPITYGDSNTMIPLLDAKGYSYKLYDQTGTEIPFEITSSESEPGSNYEFSDDVTVYTNVINFTRPAGCTAIYIVATEPAPAPAKLILNVGENGKVVMDNGTFGNATDASNIVEVHAPINVADGSKIFIVDDHTANLVEGGSINIATGGELSFYPSADNTGKITAIPDEGYICTGWYNGDTRYTIKDTIDYQEISEDMTLTAKFAPDLFPQHSITLGGNIGVNFYIDSAAADFANASTAVVKFTWDGGGEDRTKEVNLKELTPNADGYYKATVDVVAAQMAHKIHAEVYLNGEKLEQTDDYSVQDYAETVYANPAEYDSEKPEQLKALAKALLNYGAMAQTVFASSLKEHPALANTVVGNNGYEGVTADQIEGAINGEASDLNEVAAQLGAKYYTNSLIYLSKNTLRIYFTPNSYPGEIPNASAYDGNLSGYYYYVDHADIPAAELDDQQTFNVNGTEFTFSALDYAKAVVESTKMEPEQQNLAKALYLYNQKANAYFDAAPAPVENVVDLGTLEGDYEAQNNDVLTGKLVNQYKITIADGATVTLKDADITCLSSNTQYDGIALLGDATILLEGENTVKGGYKYNAGIFVPENKTLSIDGTGSLNVSSGGSVAAIGAKRSSMVNGTPGGNIVINGGTINATGGNGGAGIGGCTFANCGTITINGGNITAVGNDNAPGIGSGNSASFCASITINGGTVTATGNKYAAGIGSGQKGRCGDITIAGTVTQVTATKGEDATYSIGAGKGGSCGTITIGGAVVDPITESPYTYQPN